MKEGGGGEEGKTRLLALLVCLQNPYTSTGWTGALIGAAGHVLIDTRGTQSMKSMTIDINQYQSISINRSILIIDDQSMAKNRVVIDWYRLSITNDR